MLFDLEQPKDNSPIENVHIKTVHLFYSESELVEFRKLAKAGIIKMYPHTFQSENISDFIFQLLKLYNDEQSLSSYERILG